jgi:DNA-binding XRE family transcriptional regulator
MALTNRMMSWYAGHTVTFKPYVERRPVANSQLLDRLRARRTLPTAEQRREIRLGAGASLRDVAREIGVSATSVIRWERGASPGRHTIAYGRLLEELDRLAGDP